MSERFERRYGVITELSENGMMQIQVKRNHACVGCHGNNTCGVAEDAGFSAEVAAYDGAAAGDRVEVIIPTRDLYRSVGLVYVLPIAIVLVLAVVLDTLFGADLVTALASLGFLGGYFVVLKGILAKKHQRETIKVRPLVEEENA